VRHPPQHPPPRHVGLLMTGAFPPPGSTKAWAGRAVTNARTWYATTHGLTLCARCGQPITGPWHLGHKLDRQRHPHLTWEPGNWQAEHPHCSTSSGATQGNQRRTSQESRSRGLKGAQNRAARATGLRDQSNNSNPANARLLFNPPQDGGRFSPKPHADRPAPAEFVSGFNYNGRVVPETLSRFPRNPGPEDGLPRVFSPVHPDAVASLGDEMVAFAERRRGGPLRWFQWLTAQRRYEVRADGSWCWPLVFESTSRQQGKSITLAEDAAWYCSRATDPELVLHAAHRVKTSLDVQSDLWPWAEDTGLEVRRLLGDSRVVWPQGAVWATVAMESSYGRRPWRLLMDEAWAMHPVRFWNSLFPALGARVAPQALFWSTANPEERGLVSDLRSDPGVCRMEWGALPGEDLGDEGVWRASSAFWGPGRAGLMRAAVLRPGFAEEWLNVWPSAVGVGPVALPGWMSLPDAGVEPARGGVVVVDEARDGGRFGVLRLVGWYRVFYRETTDLVEAARVADAAEHVVVGMTMVDPLVKAGMRAVPVRFGVKELRMFTPLLQQVVAGGRLAHDHDALLNAQASGARVVESEAGRTLSALRSDADILGVKLVAWALGFHRGAMEQPRARIF
jgi:hypothetical protein